MKLKHLLYSLLPGLFLIGFNIGTGSVTAMAKAGANYGMGMLWALAISCLVTGFLIIWFGKFTIVTGETALAAFRKHLHPAVGLFFIAALTINVAGGIMGVMGIVADVMYSWSLTWWEGGISPLIWAVIGAVLVYGLFWVGTTKFFEKILAGLVAFMGLCFFLNVALQPPNVMDLLNGLLPSVPEGAVVSNSGGPFLVIAGMVGTTVSSMVFIVRTTLVREQGWTVKDLKVQSRDARVSAVLMFLISAAIMASAASALHSRGLSLDQASDMIGLLEPVAGPLAVGIFALGIAAAGLSSQFPNTLLLPWLLCDYFGWKRDMKQPRFRIIVAVMSSLALVVPLFGGRPILVMIASQALAALILPATVLGLILMLNKKDLMGEHRPGPGTNAVLVGILLFALLMCGFGLLGIWQEL